MFRSVDGGRRFDLLPAPHGDHHGLWIDPDNPQRLINGNDGGAIVSTDGGKTDRKSTRLNSSHGYISYAVFCLKKKKKTNSRGHIHREVGMTQITVAHRL